MFEIITYSKRPSFLNTSIIIMQASQEQEYEEKRDFINTNPLFRSWNTKFRRLLEMSIRKEVYNFGDYIVKQGEPVEGLHFIIR